MSPSVRTTYLTATCVCIAAGLLSRWHILGLPAVVAKYSGSIVWGTMVYFAVASLLPARLNRKVPAASVIAVAVEFSQLIHVDWLDAFRRTTIGVLLIGRFFSWWDIACYLIGITAGALLDHLLCHAIPSVKLRDAPLEATVRERLEQKTL